MERGVQQEAFAQSSKFLASALALACFCVQVCAYVGGHVSRKMHAKEATIGDEETGDARPSRELYVARMDTAVRQGFIKKVYGILTLQLLWTFSVVALFTLSPSVRGFVERTPGVLGVTLFAYFASFLALVCCGERAQRTVPTNYYLLSTFTVATSVMVAVSACAYSPLSVLLATFFTFAIFGALTVYAHATKTEWSFGAMGTLAMVWSLLLLAGASAFFPISSAAMALLGALLFCGYIVVDTQALLTRLGPDDYVFAALSLFLDLVNLFLRLLQLLGQRER